MCLANNYAGFLSLHLFQGLFKFIFQINEIDTVFCKAHTCVSYIYIVKVEKIGLIIADIFEDGS